MTRLERLLLLLDLDMSGKDPAGWTLHGQPLNAEQMATMREVNMDDFHDVAALLLLDAELALRWSDVSG